MDTIMAIDLGKFNSLVCLYDVKTGADRYKSFKTNPFELQNIVVAHPVDMIVFEACDIIGWICDLLDNLGLKYEVANTNDPEFSGKRLKKKTDKGDALMLARRMALTGLPTIYVPQKETREKRAFLNYRQSLTQRITEIKNTIRSLLSRQARELLAGKSGWSKSSIEYLRKMSKPMEQVDPDELWRGSLHTELALLESNTDALKSVEDKLAELNKNDPQVQLLLTIPGVGPRLAEAVAAYIDDPHRFANCKQLGSYIGMTPRQYQSGITDRQGRISKDGNSLLRSLLVEVSWLGLRHNAWIRAAYDRIRRDSKTRSKIAIVAVARQLFVRMWAMLRDGTPWQMPEMTKQTA